MLFEEKERNDFSLAKHQESTFEYYDRSATELAVKVRTLLNKWFENYPEEDKNNLQSRLEYEFESCFFELVVFQLFKKMGYEIEIHPSLPDSKKSPDFLMKKGVDEIYVEAKAIKDDTENAHNKIRARVLDRLNRINTPNFYLSINEFVLKKIKSPSEKKISVYIENEIKKFDPDEVIENKNKYLDRFGPQIIYENEKVKLEVTLIPIKKEFRGRKDRKGSIGVYGDYGVKWNNIVEVLTNALSKKAGYYGKLNKPFIVFINYVGDHILSQHNIYDTLFGREKVIFENKKPVSIQRELEGFFGDGLNPNYKRLSGVFFTRIFPSNLHVAEHWLVKHPFSNKSIDMNMIDLKRIELKTDRIIEFPGKKVSEVLGIPEDWFIPNF
ncbi:hypothetical protein [Gracilimonas sp.]|uniref:hypothetical protein n=1 Tax=Gracilimonas sp. TaxID=1974203 RepID=UPI0032ED49D9